ncbi:MAG: zf-HC2 domain-containing protein [Planctomycetes bacterium]|nr:zf-HC2 domain-containing protein [Planctomycetota bacterium]
MNCDEARDLIQERMVGRLDAGAAARLDAHIAECAACGVARDELAATESLVRRRYAPATPPAGLLPALLRRIEAERAEEPPLRLFRREALPLALAAATLLGAVGLWAAAWGVWPTPGEMGAALWSAPESVARAPTVLASWCAPMVAGLAGLVHPLLQAMPSSGLPDAGSPTGMALCLAAVLAAAFANAWLFRQPHEFGKGSGAMGPHV